MKLLFAVLGIAALYGAMVVVLYRRTDYYKSTKNPYLTVRFDAGRMGEYLIYKYLRDYEKDGAKFLYNCYLPKNQEETTEIDVLMIHTSGIYVFESKNYSGWIFGSEKQKTWTQSLPSGNKSKKEHFLNPIMQNNLHIKCLKEYIGEDYPIHSIIVFSERCTLKQINLVSDDIKVIKRDQVWQTVKQVEHQSENRISQEHILSIYKKLYPLTQVSDSVKEKHIEDIKTAHTKETVGDDTEKTDENVLMQTGSELVCPRCGGTLVLRTTKRGENAGKQFYGCSNYPKCRYMKNVEQ